MAGGTSRVVDRAEFDAWILEKVADDKVRFPKHDDYFEGGNIIARYQPNVRNKEKFTIYYD